MISDDDRATTGAEDDVSVDVVAKEPPRNQTPEALRALAEAEERRRQRAATDAQPREKEVGGQDGPDPVRYGDWEKGGIAWDF